MRPYQAGDEAKILALFSAVFGVARSQEQWNWQFLQNPYGPVHATLAISRDEVLVAQYAVMPVRLYVLGRAVNACQTVDGMVNTSFRGQGLFKQAAAESYVRLHEAGIEVVFGFPNRDSLPGFLRQLGWRRIGYFSEYSLRIGVSRGVAKRLRSPLAGKLVDQVWCIPGRIERWLRGQRRRRAAGRAFEFKIHDRVPEGCDPLCARQRGSEMLAVWKDAAYFEWRYDRQPERTFQYATLVDDRGLAALAVIHADPVRGNVLICELVIRNRQVEVSRMLVAEIVLYWGRSGYDMVQLLASDNGFSEASCVGFKKETRFDLVFGARVLSADPQLDSLVYDRQSWTLTAGDTDLI